MRRKCCVPNCDSGTKCRICQVGFNYYKTPRDPSMFKRWELALGLKSQSLRPQDRVCNSHFRKYDIITKRFVSLKRPTTNSKMILEISKLERYAVPTIFSYRAKQCSHGRAGYKSIKYNANNKSSRTESASSESASSRSDATDDSSADDHQQQQQQQQTLLPLEGRRDYRAAVDSGVSRSNRRHIRALINLRAKWLEKKKNLAREIRHLEARIAEFHRDEQRSSESQ